MNLEDYKVDSKSEGGVLLGSNDFGRVYLHDGIGNSQSEVRIAYLIGMHPLESKVHRALFETLTSKTDFNYSYSIYNIDVLEYGDEGRMEGQLLAQEFVRDEIISQKYDLFVDVHSNRAMKGMGKYEISNFLFAPGFDDKSENILDNILDDIPEIEYYIPEFRSSPSFITEPTSKSGIATVVYETYTYEPTGITYDLISKLIESVDNLRFPDKDF